MYFAGDGGSYYRAGTDVFATCLVEYQIGKPRKYVEVIESSIKEDFILLEE